MSRKIPPGEKSLRENYQMMTEWLDNAWDKSGPVGKLFLLIGILSLGTPFLFELVSLLVVWYWVIPIALSLTDRLAVLGFLFVLLNVMALKIARFSEQLIVFSYVTRPLRRRRAPSK